MSLWVDKYRPRALAELDYHPQLSSRLGALVRPYLAQPCSRQWTPCTADDTSALTWTRQANSADFPHMLFYGPSGAGKKTRIMCTLRALFGPGVEKVRPL